MKSFIARNIVFLIVVLIVLDCLVSLWYLAMHGQKDLADWFAIVAFAGVIYLGWEKKHG